MTEVAEADLELVQARSAAVIGYGPQARAQVLCLRDSGVDVRLGLPAEPVDPRAATAASAPFAACRALAPTEGIRVVEAYEACEESDLVVLLLPDDEIVATYLAAVEPNLVEGDAIVLGSGSMPVSATARGQALPEGVDVVLVAPTASGADVRREFEAGRGVPALIAVEQDASGEAASLALSYAMAIGATRAGVLETTAAVEVRVRAELARRVTQEVPRLVTAAAADLVAAGYDERVVGLLMRQAFDGAVTRVHDRLETAGQA